MYISITTIFVGGSFAGANFLLVSDQINLIWLILTPFGYGLLCWSFFHYRSFQILYKQYGAYMSDAFLMALNRSLSEPLVLEETEFIQISKASQHANWSKFGQQDRFWKVPRLVAEIIEDMEGANLKSPERSAIIAPLIGIVAFLLAWAGRITEIFCATVNPVSLIG